MRRILPSSLILSAFLLPLCTLGCSSNFSSPTAAVVTTTHTSISGSLHGGQQGIIGASIQLYAAGEPTTGGDYGSGAVALIPLGVLPVTDINGNFNITGDYVVPPTARHFYIVASGGSAAPGLPPNSHIALMAVLSGCTPSIALSPSLFVTINEVSTVAAVMTLQPFMASPTLLNTHTPLLGAPASAYNSMQNGFATVNNMVDLASATSLTHTQSYPTTDNNALLLNSMANSLASCINSVDGSGQCPALFNAVTPNGQSFIPLDTIQAAQYMAQNPTNNVPAIFQLGGTNPPFAGLLSAPSSFAVTTSTANSACQAPIAMGTSANYAVLAGSTITNSSTILDPTVITGGFVGVSPGSAETGFIPVASTATIDNADAAAAKIDLTTAFTTAAALPSAATLPTDMSNLTFTPGLYKTASSVSLNSGTLTLDGRGDPHAIFIFQIGSTLTAGGGTQVILTNGASAANIFWQVGSSATINGTAAWQGNIMAAASISFGTDATLTGRALAQTGAVTLLSNQINVP